MEKEKTKNFILSLFFPARCTYCGKVVGPEDKICEDCDEKLERIKDACKFCGARETDCTCRRRAHAFDGIAVPFYYEGVAALGVKRLKYKEYPADLLAYEMAYAVNRVFPKVKFDLVAYVPMTDAKRRTRGFDQSRLLAERLSKEIKLPFPEKPVLRKIADGTPQHTLKGVFRAGNVLGMYAVTEDAEISGKTILLVDDIKTTGATLHECAKMMKLHGSKAVYAACCTTAPPKVKASVETEERELIVF